MLSPYEQYNQQGMPQRQQTAMLGEDQKAALAQALRQGAIDISNPQQGGSGNAGVNEFAKQLGAKMSGASTGADGTAFSQNNNAQMGNAITPDMVNQQQFAPQQQMGVNQITPNMQNQNMMQQQYQQGLNPNQFRGIY